MDNKLKPIIVAQQMKKISVQIDKDGRIISQSTSNSSINALKIKQQERAKKLGLK